MSTIRRAQASISRASLSWESSCSSTQRSGEVMQLVETLRVRNTLGEGIQWDVETGAVWWTDIQERTILRYVPSTGRLDTFAMPERVGSFGLIEGSDNIVAA